MNFVCVDEFFFLDEFLPCISETGMNTVYLLNVLT